MITKTRGEIYEEVLAEFRSGNYKNTDLKSEWVSLKEHDNLIKSLFNEIRLKFNSKKQLSSCDFGIMKYQLDRLEKKYCLVVPLSPDVKCAEFNEVFISGASVKERKT
jgi:hypothetical protein